MAIYRRIPLTPQDAGARCATSAISVGTRERGLFDRRSAGRFTALRGKSSMGVYEQQTIMAITGFGTVELPVYIEGFYDT